MSNHTVTLGNAAYITLTLFSLSLKAQNTFPGSGNVGIGTPTPQYSLHVIGATKTDRLHFTYGSYLNLGNSDGAGRFRLSHQNTGQADLIFQTSNDNGTNWNNGLTLNSSGNVTLPGSITMGTIYPRGSLTIGAPDKNVNSALSIRQSNNVNYGFDFALDGTTNGNGYFRMIQGNVSVKDVMVFDRGNGHVGIGATPNTAFHVATTGYTGDDAWVQVQRQFSNASAVGYLINPSGILSASNKLWAMSLNGNSNDFNLWNWNGSTSTISLTALSSNGFVGIGTTAPTQMLSVKGTVLAAKVKVSSPTTPNNPDWPDYVFNEKYKLRSLRQLENYVQKHRHLPDVPSATEVKRDGLDLAETEVVLLKKIEEITLYVLQQNTQIKRLKKRLEALAVQK